MHITAQLDEIDQEKIQAIQQATHLDANQIIKQALNLLYEKTAVTPQEKNKKLIDMLSGIGHGEADDSTNYKNHIAEHLNEKFRDS